MTSQEWINLQEGLLYTFNPVLHWLIAFMIAGGVIGAIYTIWIGLLHRLTK
jgi:hypothetical protein